MADNPRDLPSVAQSVPAEVRNPVMRAIEALQVLLGFRGDRLDMAVTWRQLKEQGFALIQNVVPSGGSAPGTIVVPGDAVVDATPDLTPPPTATGLTAVAGITNVVAQWDPATYTQGHGHLQTNIYAVKRNPGDALPVFADAVLVDEATGALTIASLPSEPNIRWHIWIKWKTKDGIESTSPTGGTNGVTVTTGQDVTHLLDVLTQSAYNPASPYTKVSFRADQFFVAPMVTFDQESTPTGTAVGQLWFQPSTGVTKTWNGSAWTAFSVPLPFVVQTTPMTVNGVLIPAGVYMDSAYINNLTAMWGRFGTLIADSIAVGQINAANLTLGDGTIGGNLKSSNFVTGVSGWRVQPNGTAEFNGVTVRGTIYASAGQIGGANINSTNVRSSGYVADTSGWSLDNATGRGEFNDLRVRGTLDIKSGTSGGRVEMAANYIKVYDTSNVKRVQIGDLSA